MPWNAATDQTLRRGRYRACAGRRHPAEREKGATSLIADTAKIQPAILAVDLIYGRDKRSRRYIFNPFEPCPAESPFAKNQENSPQYHLVAAGLLLGVALHLGTSFPVRNVDFLDMQPLTFTEFVLADNHENLADLLKTKDFELIKHF